MGKVLIACEESQEVCKAFRSLGYESYSCDVQDCSGGHPEWHIKGDAVEEAYSGDYSLMIAHPPCTYMSRAGARWMYPKAGELSQDRLEKGLEAKDFFLKLLKAPIKYKAIENPTPLKVIGLPKFTQALQPYQFGHPYSKRTLLWLIGLPELTYTDIVSDYVPYLPSNTGGKSRGQKATRGAVNTQKEFSTTFSGVAKAMAEQWGHFLNEF
jgi:hypothetical protein